jgi:starch synthase
VRATGGLRDTVIDADEETLRRGTATGFAFGGPSTEALVGGIERALKLYRQPIAWRRLQTQAMARRFGWDEPARQYLALYRSLAPEAEMADLLPAPDPLTAAE